MIVSCGQQLLSTVLAGAKSALKDEANGFKFAEVHRSAAQILDCPRRTGDRFGFDRV
jgi:hypothetical protein